MSSLREGIKTCSYGTSPLEKVECPPKCLLVESELMGHDPLKKVGFDDFHLKGSNTQKTILSGQLKRIYFFIDGSLSPIFTFIVNWTNSFRLQS